MTFAYAEASLEDLDARGQELRKDIAELYQGERSESFLESKTALFDEVDLLDKQWDIAFRQGARHPALQEGTGTIGAHEGVPEREQWLSGGDRIMQAEGMRAFVEGGMKGDTSFIVDHTSIHDFTQGVRAVFPEYGAGGPGNNASSGVNSLLPVGQPIFPTPRQAMLFMRDLIPTTTTTLSQIPYVRELTPTDTEGGATAVAEGGLKPDTTDEFQPAVAYVTVIAGNISPSKQLWADAPLVASYFNQRLPYKVKFREDAEFLNGSGTFPDIQGLSTVTGHLTQSATSGEYAITLGAAIAQIENHDGAASAVVMNPTDAWAMFTKRAASGAGTFDAGTPFSAFTATVWGLPVKRSRAYAAGSALVGDYAHGALIADREQVNVQIYTQHSDYAARNMLLVQAEERVGLLITRPDLFCVATLTA